MEIQETRRKPWWREIQVLWLTVLVVGVYFTRIDDLNLHGEETRRAQVAAEMLWSGDWLVPHQQGQIYLSRPPLGSWAIAAVAEVWGSLDAVTVRLPTILATLLTTLLIYAYTRNFLSRTGAFLAAVAYPTMAQVLQLGRVAESEGLFTLLISASLLIWHWGYLRKWPAHWMWTTGYVLSALAGLTKGPQGIAYFIGPVWFYLIVLERHWRELLRPAHILGVIAGLATIAAWQAPYVLATSWEAGLAVWFTQASNRFAYPDVWKAARHFVSFPFEILACTLPWSLALAQLFNRNFWRAIQPIRSEVHFLLVALLVTFPTVWFAPFARGRYFMPLYPLIAILCGIVLDRCAFAQEQSWLNRGWRNFLLTYAAVAVVGGAAVCVLAFEPDWVSSPVMIPEGLALGFLAASLAVAAWLFLSVRAQSPLAVQTSIWALAALLGLSSTGVVMTSQVARQPRVPHLLAEVESELPQDAKLISFGLIPHAFAYYYGEFIPTQPWPEKAARETFPAYFCFRKIDLEKHRLPFAWEPIAEMSFEDDDEPSRPSYVVIARRLPSVAQKIEPHHID